MITLPFYDYGLFGLRVYKFRIAKLQVPQRVNASQRVKFWGKYVASSRISHHDFIYSKIRQFHHDCVAYLIK